MALKYNLYRMLLRYMHAHTLEFFFKDGIYNIGDYTVAIL